MSPVQKFNIDVFCITHSHTDYASPFKPYHISSKIKNTFPSSYMMHFPAQKMGPIKIDEEYFFSNLQSSFPQKKCTIGDKERGPRELFERKTLASLWGNRIWPQKFPYGPVVSETFPFFSDRHRTENRTTPPFPPPRRPRREHRVFFSLTHSKHVHGSWRVTHFCN